MLFTLHPVLQIFQRKAEEIENDVMLPEEHEEHKTYLLKAKYYLMKIIAESSSDMSVTEKVSNSCFKNFFQVMQ